MGQSRLRIAMAQLNFLVGDVAGNASRICQALARARDELAADVVLFPELSLTGYPPEDLLLREGLHRQVERALRDIAGHCRGITAVVGHPRRWQGHLYNAASVLAEGAVLACYHKQHLPNYSVFDEVRYFTPGQDPCVVMLKGVAVGITLCEDIWFTGPARQARAAGARLLLNLNASPFHLGKAVQRQQVVAERARETGLPVVYVNLVGGQDELVFDGASFVMTPADGEPCLRLAAFDEALEVVEFDIVAGESPLRVRPGTVQELPQHEAAAYRALVLGVRDYVRKNGFAGAVLGLSGGIDSALSLVVAADALGAENVEAVMLPSRYTSRMSLEDAESLARAVGVEYRVISIEPVFESFTRVLAEEFVGTDPDVTEENIQARSRGVILMAISNKKGKLVLSTGNKSEMAVGYSTLYGDMAGGLDVLKDVPKTLVFRLAEYRNRQRALIPRRIIERPPSAELAPGQKDEDSLPPYALLDPILERYVEQDRSVADIVAEGYDPQVVSAVARMVDRNEYKRRQAPPGIRITSRAFGKDRRYPITSGFVDD